MPETAVYNCEKVKTTFNKLFYLNNIAISKVGVAKMTWVCESNCGIMDLGFKFRK